MITKLGHYPWQEPEYRDEGPARGRMTGQMGGYAVPMALKPADAIRPKLLGPGPVTDSGRYYCACGRSVHESGAARHRRICGQ